MKIGKVLSGQSVCTDPFFTWARDTRGKTKHCLSKKKKPMLKLLKVKRCVLQKDERGEPEESIVASLEHSQCDWSLGGMARNVCESGSNEEKETM